MDTKNPMDSQTLRYDKMVERALRGVVRAAVQEVMADGLQDDHHFYITFLTEHPGVQLPEYLKTRYPGEMTIVLQYQFYDLFVDDTELRVTLSFNNVPERMIIPLEAITIFADPAVNFALQFQPINDELGGGDGGVDGGGDALPLDTAKSDDGKKGEVVSLDSFRKK